MNTIGASALGGLLLQREAPKRAVAPLAPAQRMQLRGLLHELWRERLDELTQMSIEAHRTDGSTSDQRREATDARLWALRRALVEIESAIKRLDSGSFGHCDSCDRRIDFAVLRRQPHRRYCTRCERSEDTA